MILWDFKKADKIKVLSTYTRGILYCQYTFDGKKIISANRDGKITIWDTEQYKVLKTLIGHKTAIISFALHPNNNNLISISGDRKLKFWQINNSQPLSFRHRQNVQGCAISPNNRTVAYFYDSGPFVALFDLYNKDFFARILGVFINDCVFSPDGQKIALVSIRGITIYEVKTQKFVMKLNPGKSVKLWRCHYSPDGRYIVAVGSSNTVFIWDVYNSKSSNISKKPMAIFTGHRAHIRDCKFNKDGTLLASIDNLGAIKIWSRKSIVKKQVKIPLLELKWSTQLTCLDFHLDGNRMVTGDHISNIILWDIKKRKKVAIFQGHTQRITQCFFSMDGKRIISASKDTTIKVWDIEARGKLVGNVRLVTSSLLTLKKHTDLVNDLAISKDGKKIISASVDKTIKIWNIERN